MPIVQAILPSPSFMSKAADRALLVLVSCSVLAFIVRPELGAPSLAVVLVGALCLQVAGKSRAERELKAMEAALRASQDTIRDLGARLQVAQEEERARIARELHDDISQQLVVLQIELRHASTAGASKRVEEIGRSVHELANRLYPARLRALGLSGALQLLASECSRPPLVVSVTHGNVPPEISPSHALCLYRVTQEALQNAAKHSRARRVMVDLQSTETEFRLTIGDDGVGFAPQTGGRNGLGLMSIMDRVEAAGGRVTIHSTSGDGARLEVALPLSS